MAIVRLSIVSFCIALLCADKAAAEQAVNLYSPDSAKPIVLVVPEKPEPLEEYAAEELARHIEQLTGKAPVKKPVGIVGSDNVVVIGRVESNEGLKRLEERRFFKPNQQEQGYALRIDKNPFDKGHKTWLAALCGADPLGTLYAVRDFCHYHLYKVDGSIVLQPARVSIAPRLKMRILEESGFNLFSAKNDRPEYLDRPGFNLFSRGVVFDKQHFVDWCSEWKMTHINVLWCNHPAYETAFTAFHRYANSRGIKVLIDFVAYRPNHESPPSSISSVAQFSTAGDCARDPNVRRWYEERLKYLITRKPLIDGIMLESPYHDRIYCQCNKCRNNPYPEDELLNRMIRIVRQHRPDMWIELSTMHPVPDVGAAKKLAEKYKGLTGPHDWHMNTVCNRDHRRRWHDLGPAFGTYLRTFRSALRGENVPAEIEFLFNDFKMSAERGIRAHEWCYRFYGGRYGSYRVKDEPAVREQYPGRLGPFSLALVCEAAFDPFVSGEARFEKISRIHALTIPDYPRVKGTIRPLPLAALKPKAKGQSASLDGPVIEDLAARPAPSKLFRDQYGFHQPGEYLLAGTCVDLDNDGSREFFYASRKTHKVHLVRAADGRLLSSEPIPGDHQSVSVHDLDGNGDYEILYVTSDPGRLNVLDSKGRLLRHASMGDWKTGNTPVIFDADGDGILDGYFGTRTKSLVRMNMQDLSIIAKRPWPGQCACHTATMDVDKDGRWDLFAGAGDDQPERRGMLHRFDPITLKSLWSHKIEDNASSSDVVLADIDGDGNVELLKSVDSTHSNDAKHDALFAFETDGELLWKVEVSGMDTANVADLDGDGSVEIVGMTFGGEVYCLDSKGRLKWRKDLRPDLDVKGRCCVAPIICDLDGDRELEILAVTNGAYFLGDQAYGTKANGILFAVSADGEILDRFDVGRPRAWMNGSYDITVCNIDNDPYLELILSGSEHVDVFETRGFGPNSEVFEPRQSYQRLHVVPWAYEDSYFIYRGNKKGVVNLADNLVLAKQDGRYRESGTFTTELLTLPPGGFFDRITYDARVSDNTSIRANILNRSGKPILPCVTSGKKLDIRQPVRLEFVLSTSDNRATPILDSYRLSFDRQTQ